MLVEARTVAVAAIRERVDFTMVIMYVCRSDPVSVRNKKKYGGLKIIVRRKIKYY